MITKEQVKEILTKNPAGITKEELKFVLAYSAYQSKNMKIRT